MSNDDFLRETGKFFHDQIPITRAIGVEVESFEEGRLVLTAPLATNHNHLGTAFGGSLAAVATLAGYGMVWLLMKDRDAHVVIRDSTIRYLHPVTGLIRAVCDPPGEEDLQHFLGKFRRKGRASICLKVVVRENDRTCVEFVGTFVALR